MNVDTLDRLDEMFAESPIMRADDAPTGEEIDDAAGELGVSFDADYREFVRTVWRRDGWAVSDLWASAG